MNVPVAMVAPLQSEDDIRDALRALTVWNVGQLTRRNRVPLYASGIRYRREQARVGQMRERWQTADSLYRRMYGDCEDLACLRAAELNIAGERARAVPVRVPGGWHIVVEHESGRIEDPSERLGMR